MASYTEHRATLPEIVFLRAKARIQIDLASELLTSPESARALSLSLFFSAVREIVEDLHR